MKYHRDRCGSDCGEHVLEIGDTFLDRYEVLARLGAGGFGEVYQARQKTTGQLVAIKVIRLPPDQPEKREALEKRFNREMELCAKLHHPNIVRLIDAGTKDGRPFTIFSYVPGKNLAEILRDERQLDPAEALHLMQQVLDALCAAHHIGVIHRDLKPANIMITESGARRNATVLDFGIAAIVDGLPNEHDEKLTAAGDVIGTPQYAAPEQLLGQAPTVRTDLYSWGLVLLECLVGPSSKRLGYYEAIYEKLSPDGVRLPSWLAGHPVGRVIATTTNKNVDLRTLDAADIFRILQGAGSPPRPEELDDPEKTRRVPRADPPAGRIMPTLPEGVETHHTPPTRQSAVPPTPSGVRELRARRQVTAVACAFSVSGRAASDLEEVDEAMSAVHALCERHARDLGGCVGHTLTDRVLLYFGFPRAQDGSAIRAVQAGLAIADDVAALNLEGVRVDVCVGIHTGLIIAHEDGDTTPTYLHRIGGLTPAIAEAISAMSSGGSVLVSADTRRLVLDHFTLTSRGFHGPGAAKDIETFEVLLGPSGPKLLEERFGEDSTPFVGRQFELGMLLDLWNQASDGSGMGVLVSGEAGIGKSRIARELVRGIQAGDAAWLECRCRRERQNGVLDPFVDIVERLIGFRADTDAALAVHAIEKLVERCRLEREPAVTLLATLLGLPESESQRRPLLAPDKHRQATIETLSSLLLAFAEDRPLLLVIEDLHWADATTLELVSFLSREACTVPILVLATARPEFEPPWPSDVFRLLQLGRMPRNKCEEMIARIAGPKPLPPQVVAQIIDRTDGVALFVEELTGMVLGSDAIAEEADRYVLAGDIHALGVPVTLRELLSVRLDRTGEAKATAQAAAAIGREFSEALLLEVVGLDRNTLDSHMLSLIEAGVVQRRGRRDQSSFSFRHALIRDIAQESLLKNTRRAVFRRIAETIERHHAHIAENQPDRLAHYWKSAGDGAQARVYCVRAGERAMAVAAYSDAINQFRQAIELATAIEDQDEGAAVELELQMKLALPVMMTRGYSSTDLREIYDRARELCKQVGSTPSLFQAVHGLWTYYLMRGDLPAALDLSRHTAALAEEAGEDALLLEAHLAQGNTLCWMGDVVSAETHVARLVELYDPVGHRAHIQRFGHDPLVACYSFGVWGMWTMGFPDTALARGRRAMQIANELDHPHARVMALQDLSIAHLHRCEWEDAAREAQAMVDLAREKDLAFWLAFGRFILGRALVGLGRGVEALRMLESAIDDCHALGSSLCDGMFGCHLASAQLAMGRARDAMSTVNAALDGIARQQGWLYEAELHRLRGESILEMGGAPDEAAASFRKALEAAESRNQRMLALRSAASLMKVARGTEQDVAKSAVEAALKGFSEGFDTADLEQVRALIDLPESQRAG